MCRKSKKYLLYGQTLNKKKKPGLKKTGIL
jgi:hypothetical protein